MERINFSESGETPVHIYHARSIKDMVESRDEVVGDFFEKLYEHLEERMREEKAKGELILHLRFRLPSFILPLTEPLKPQKREVVYLLNARHSPEKDKEKKLITIFDATGECEVLPPPNSIPREIRPNYKVLKSQSWASDVILLNSYRQDGSDEYMLIHVRNRLAGQKQEESLNRLIINLQPLLGKNPV